jgi:[protein-PII] uridylyltransferase
MMLARTPAFAPLPGVASLPTEEIDATQCGAVAREYVTRIRRDVRARHEAGEGGLAVVAAYTDAIDHLVQVLFAAASSSYMSRYPRINQRCAAVGLGGYGRGELNPDSDIDLLFLYPWKVNPYVETIAETILYALWDAGLQVGHALRNPRECARLAARDLKVKTAVLDARCIAGDEGLFREFDAAMLEEVWAYSPADFFREKLTESIERHERAGDSVYLLQPQMKEGTGGLRDLHTALWMAKVKFKVRNFRELVPIGVAGERDVQELERALDFLWRLRNAMHLSTNSHQDQLTFDLQEQLAPEMGFPAGRGGVEAFMRAYYAHATTVNRFSDDVIDRCMQGPVPYRGIAPSARVIRDGMRIVARTLAVSGREVFVREPAALVAVFTEAQRHEVELAPATQALIRESAELLAAHREEPEVAAAFLAILRGKARVYETLIEMHKLGVLNQLIPEFVHMDCLVTRDPFHIYTVDQHSLMGIRELERLRAGEFASTLPHVTQVVHESLRPELLFLGMIFHDVGKGHGHDHSGRGAVMMREIARRLGLDVDESAACEFLVQHHLLMSHLAQRRDVHDDQLVADFCRQVGTVENLQRLYLLTYADMRAVAPGVWTNWRDSLITELYVRAREFFDKGLFEAEDRAARVRRIRSRVVATASPRERPAVEALLDTMPDSYVLSTPEELIPAHADLRRHLGEREGAGETPVVVTHVAHFPDRDYSELAVCTRDRPGLFAMLSGVLAGHGMNILAARITTSRDGLALDAFRLSYVDPADDAERWERVDRTLRRVLSGEVDVEALVRRHRRPSVLARRRRAATTRIEIDNAVSRDFTVLDVYTADRVGLLFTITNCLYHLWLEIHLAKITTMVDQVLDVFYVTDPAGRKIEDPERLTVIQRELERALADDGGVPEAARAAGG